MTDPALPSTIGSTECRLIRIHLVVLAHVHIRKVTRRFRPAVHGEMLRRRNGEVILGIIALQSGYIRHAHAAGEKWVLAVGLLSAAPARIAKDVQIRRPEVEASHDAGVSFAQILHVLDAALDAYLCGHRMNAWRVEGRGEPNRLRVLGHTLIDDSMESLAPPLICRDIEPRHSGGVVLHLGGFLGKRHPPHQIRGALLGRELGIHVGETLRGLRACILQSRRKEQRSCTSDHAFDHSFHASFHAISR